MKKLVTTDLDLEPGGLSLNPNYPHFHERLLLKHSSFSEVQFPYLRRGGKRHMKNPQYIT